MMRNDEAHTGQNRVRFTLLPVLAEIPVTH
uniref:Uncharacterized protein n=1 Tax=Anguilla anguilla TaxID=7936 RepID=A0A0E9U571_ANGAN